MTTLEIHYHSPEGPRRTEFKTDEDALKVIAGFQKYGFNLVRQNDQLYIPYHSIIAISHLKTNV